MRGIRIVLVISMLAMACAGQHGPERKAGAATPNGAGLQSEAVAILTQFERHWRRLEASEQALVLGIAKTELGRYADAIPHLQSIPASTSLHDYALYYLGLAALGASDGARAAEAFAALRQQYPQSRWAHPAAEGLVDAALVRRDFAQAASALADLQTLATTRAARRRVGELLARVAYAQGDVGAAADRLYLLYSESQYPGEVARVRQVIAELSKLKAKDPIEQLAVAERSVLAERFMERGIPEEAVRLLEPIARREGGIAREHLAMAYFRARDYGKAAVLFAEIRKTGSQTMNQLLLLQRHASAVARTARNGDAVAIQNEIAAAYPETRTASEARYKAAYVLQDSGRCAQAIPAFEAWLTEKQRAGGSAEDARWYIAWCEYRLGRWDAALRAFDTLAQETARQPGWQARTAYWRARTLERQGKPKLAQANFREVLAQYPGTYYAHLAARRARKHPTAELFQQRAEARGNWKLPVQPPESLTERAAMLYRMGLWDHVVEEMDHGAGAKLSFDPRHHFVVQRLGQRWQIAPALALALIRQESYFRPTIVSPAGAIGLMQLMPLTAQRMAQELQWRQFREEDLFRPYPNLQLGMWYLQGLLKRYTGGLPYALAAYNAGEAAVDRWRQANPKADPEEFVESIPFRETNNYVKKILQRFWS